MGLLATFFLCGACSLPYSRYYVVQQGDTLSRIAQRHHLSEAELKKYNPEGSLSPGAKLYIPFEQVASRDETAPSSVMNPKEKEAIVYGSMTPREFKRLGLIWPVKNPKISSGFGVRGYRVHEGVDLSASRHTPVYASGDGKVIYASQRISGYGRMVIVDHGRRVRTVYAHLQKMTVKEGDELKRGALIGSVGTSGKASGPHLHFEVRNGAKAHNPVYYMPVLQSQVSKLDRPRTRSRHP